MQRSYSPTSPYMNTTYSGYKLSSRSPSMTKHHKSDLVMIAIVSLFIFLVMGFYGGWGGNVTKSQDEYNNLPDYGKNIYDFSQTTNGKIIQTTTAISRIWRTTVPAKAPAN